MTPRQRPSVHGRRTATLALLAMLATLGAVRGSARAEDPPPTAPPAPKAAPAADPAAVAPLVEQGEAPWPDLAALTRWFDETCTVVEEIVGEKFQRRPTLRVVTRWELELVLREAPLPANPSAEAIAQRFRDAREISSWKSFAHDPRAPVVCFAPANRSGPRTNRSQMNFPDRLWCVTALVSAWQAERFEWARATAATGFEEATSLQAVREGHANWVAELAARRWGAPGVVDGLIGWIGQWSSRRWFVPWADGFEFFRRVFGREGAEGIRRVLASPPQRLRDLDAPEEWLHPPPSPPPYLDLRSVADAVLAPFPPTPDNRLRPRVGDVGRGTLRQPRAEDRPVDAIRDARVDDAGHLDVSILQFRDPAAANRFAAAATAEAPMSSLLDVYWTIRTAAVESVEDGAGLDRRARGFTIRTERVYDERPTRFSRGGDVVVGAVVGRVHWTGTTASGPDADGLLAALESRLRALLRGEPVVAVEAYPIGSGPARRSGPGEDDVVRLDVLVRRPDGTPAAGAEVRVGLDDSTAPEFLAWSSQVRTRADGRATLSLRSPRSPLRIEAKPPPELELLAATATTVTDASPVVLTLAEGWIATGRVPVEDHDSADTRVVASTATGGRFQAAVDYDGSFRVPQLPAGPVALRAVRGDRNSGLRMSEVLVATPARPVAAFEPTATVERDEPSVRLVARGPGGVPVTSVRVAELRRHAPFGDVKVQTAASGEIRATYDPLERRLFVFGAVLADGRRLASRTVTVPVTPVDPLVVDLDLAVVTAGRVLDAEGRGVAGARVEGGVLGVPSAVAEAVTDASGAFRLDGLAAGPCWLALVATPSPHGPAAPVRAVGGASDVVLRVGNAADVVLSVVDPAGSPVVGADVTFTLDWRPSGREAPISEFRATSDAVGRATLLAVPAAAIGKLEVRPPTQVDLAAVVRKGTRLTSTESIRLPAAYTVSGRVERDGAGVEGANVVLATRSFTAPETWLDALVKTDQNGRFVIPHVPMGRATLRLDNRTRWDRRPTHSHDPVAVVSPERRDVVLRASKFADVGFTVDGVVGRTLHLHANGPDPARAELTADANGRFEWIEAADVPHELWIPPTPEDPRVAYLPDYVPGPTPPTLTLVAPGIARFRRPAFEGGQVDGATVEDAWVVGPLGTAFAARLVAEGRFEVDGLPPGTFPAVVRVRTGKGWVRCTGPVTVGAPEVELPRP